jgi:hypothetical protein
LWKNWRKKTVGEKKEILTWTGEGNAEADWNHLDISQMELGAKAQDYVLPRPTI